MGFLDKLKASVGVGGAKVTLRAPAVVCSGAHVPVQITVHGGDLEQKLNAIDLVVEVTRTKPDQAKHEATTQEAWKGRIDAGSKNAIAKRGDLHFEGAVEFPTCQSLYVDDPERYALLVVESDGTDEQTRWDAEGPLPFAEGWEMDTVTLIASAEIPGAIDPKAQHRVHVIPEAASPLRRTGPLQESVLSERLRAAGAERVWVSNSSDVWFLWWARGDGRVVGWARLLAATLLRPEGVIRAHTNPRIPASSVLAKVPTETADQVAGGFEEAHAWAVQLANEAGLDCVLPRPVGNAVFALADTHLA
jgi:hypothetical protein